MSITNTSNSHSDVDVMLAELLLCFAPSPSQRVKAGKTAGALYVGRAVTAITISL